jgi:hypothetical protein
MSVRAAEVLAVDGFGTLRWRFPPGGVLFPVGAAEVAALDTAVRAATSEFVVVPDPDGAALRCAALDGFIRERLAAFGHAIDPADWIPDAAQVADRVDPEHWPMDPPVVDADLTDLVLLAALCAVGPDTVSVGADTPPVRWRGLGGFGEERPDPAAGPLPEGALVVGAAVPDERVERLEFALLGADQALLAVRMG